MVGKYQQAGLTTLQLLLEYSKFLSALINTRVPCLKEKLLNSKPTNQFTTKAVWFISNT